MGNHCTQAGFTNLGTLWDTVPAGGEVIITREKVTIKGRPTLDIGKSVVSDSVNPSTYGQLMVSLSELTGEDRDAFRSPAIRVIDQRTPEGLSQNYYHAKIEDRRSRRGEFIPELTAAGVLYNSPTPSKEDSPEIYLTPDSQSEYSIEFSSRLRNETGSLFQLPRIHASGYENFGDISPTTLFTTSSIAEQNQNMLDLENYLKHQASPTASVILPAASVESKFDETVSPPFGPEQLSDEDKVALIRLGRKSAVVTNEEGYILAKKIATQAEQKGMRECHVYFTPRTCADIWPPLVVTVGENWDFVKVMRKAIANLQRSMVKGERDGTHDWLYDYNPNKDIWKIKKDLKVLFGRKIVSFRDSHLKKIVKDVTSDFINKMWILQKDEKNQKARPRSQSFHNMTRKERSPPSSNAMRHSIPKRRSKEKRYRPISKRI